MNRKLQKELFMNQQKKSRLAFLTISIASMACISALSMGCSPGFETGSSASGGTKNTGSNTGGGEGGTSSDWNAIEMTGAINGGRFDQAKVVEIDRTAKMLIVRLPFIAGFQIGAQIPMPIKDIPGATIGVEPNSDGSSSIVLRIPLDRVLRGVASLPSSRLPNGDPLPAIPDGELPSIGLSFNNSGTLKGALYLSPAVVGIFVTTKFNPYIQLTLPIRNEARTRTYGYFTTIPQKAGFDGGFFISVAFPDDLARAIDGLL